VTRKRNASRTKKKLSYDERKVQDWANSDQGREEIKRVVENTDEIVEPFRKALQIDPRILREPMTI